MGKRKSTGTRLRFEIFKRDGFRCVYCGATPLQTALQVDHVQPVADGGSSDPANLVTSCAACNAGKSDVRLERRAVAPVGGADVEAQKDHLTQIREYLKIQKQVEIEKTKAVDLLADRWEDVVGPLSKDMYGRLPGLMRNWPIDSLFEAMEITGRRLGAPGSSFIASRADDQAKYFHGILRSWKREAGL